MLKHIFGQLSGLFWGRFWDQHRAKMNQDDVHIGIQSSRITRTMRIEKPWTTVGFLRFLGPEASPKASTLLLKLLNMALEELHVLKKSGSQFELILITILTNFGAISRSTLYLKIN